MPGFSSSATIDRPKDEVFAFITDLNNAPRLSPVIVHVEPVTEGEGELREGFVFRETRRVGKREATADIRMSTYNPPDKYAASPSGRTRRSHTPTPCKMPPRAGPK